MAKLGTILCEQSKKKNNFAAPSTSYTITFWWTNNFRRHVYATPEIADFYI